MKPTAVVGGRFGSSKTIRWRKLPQKSGPVVVVGGEESRPMRVDVDRTSASFDRVPRGGESASYGEMRTVEAMHIVACIY